MDNEGLHQIIARIPELKYKFAGVFPADKTPRLKTNTFAIVNSSKSTEIGEHWIMLANYKGDLYFGDSMGQTLQSYQNITISRKQVYHLVHKRLQNLPLCGLYAIFFAWSVFSGHVLDNFLDDFSLMRFIQTYL